MGAARSGVRAGCAARGRTALGDADERRTEDTVPNPVAPLQLPQHGALWHLLGLLEGDGVVLARVERLALGGLGRRDALRLEHRPQLAVDGADALDPRRLLQVRGHVLDGT